MQEFVKAGKRLQVGWSRVTAASIVKKSMRFSFVADQFALVPQTHCLFGIGFNGQVGNRGVGATMKDDARCGVFRELVNRGDFLRRNSRSSGNVIRFLLIKVHRTPRSNHQSWVEHRHGIWPTADVLVFAVFIECFDEIRAGGEMAAG